MKRYEFQRLRRLLWPNKYDHAAHMLINACGRYWLLFAGWKREYRVGKFIIDLAHPKLKLALEGDGERWHMDVLRETERDEALRRMGWQVRHYRYPALKNQPRRVRREVRRWYYASVVFKWMFR